MQNMFKLNLVDWKSTEETGMNGSMSDAAYKIISEMDGVLRKQSM